MTYNFYYDEIQLIRRICRKHNWSRLTMMGHSLGAGVITLYASMYPNDVEKIICFDGIAPKLFDFDKYQMLREPGLSIDAQLKYEKLTLDQQPTYNYKDMIDVAVAGHRGSLTKSSAEVLMKRGMVPFKKVADNVYYRFTRDLRLINGNFGTFTIDVIIAIVEKIRCELLVFRADSSKEKFRNYSKVCDVVEKHAKYFLMKEIEGTHHFHLNKPEKISDMICDFLKK